MNYMVTRIDRSERKRKPAIYFESGEWYFIPPLVCSALHIIAAEEWAKERNR